jgi:hypothetical protein
MFFSEIQPDAMESNALGNGRAKAAKGAKERSAAC